MCYTNPFRCSLPPLALGVCLLVGSFTTLVAAERRQRFEPGLIISTKGRTAACDALLFTPGGRGRVPHLLAAGDDKVIRVWPVKGDQLDTEKARMLRWSIWREQRGSIYALALDREYKRVAFGGYGSKTGTVLVADLASGKILHALPKTSAYTVWSVAFSPTGDRVAFGKEDGTVWLWHISKGTVRLLGRHENKMYKVRGLLYRSERELFSVAEDGAVMKWDPLGTTSRKVIIFNRVPKPTHVAFSPDNKSIAVGGDGKETVANVVEMRSLDTGRSRLIELPAQYFPRSLAFSPDSRQLAIGAFHLVRGRAFHKITECPVYLCDLTQRQPRPVRILNTTDEPEVLAFHPRGTHLAVAGGANHEVALYQLGRVRKTDEISGPGKGLWGVGVSKTNRFQLGFRANRKRDPAHPNEWGTGDWHVFDLAGGAWNKGDGFRPVEPITASRGWTIQTRRKNTPLDAFKWYAFSPEGTYHLLPLDPRKDYMPRCYTFLKTPAGQPVRVAVGHYWGISIFELTEKGATRVRLFTGHQGEVMALAPSPDHKMLVSASRDQTLAGWSLGDWPTRTELGAQFRIRDGKLWVTQVDPGSPAWAVGLTSGDEVVGFTSFHHRFVYDRGLPRNIQENVRKLRFRAGTARDALYYLARPVPGKEFYFAWKRAGHPDLKQGLTTVRQRPLWRFLPLWENGGRVPDEWVLWLWRSYYYRTSRRGDFHVGWQVNGEPWTTPSFYRAEQFRQRFHKPDKVLQVVRSTIEYPEKASLVQIEPPELQLEVPERQVTARGLKVSVTIKPRGQGPEHQAGDIILWINDHKYKTWGSRKGRYDQTLVIPHSVFRHGPNQLVLQCLNSDVKGRGRSEAPRVLVTKGAGKPPPATLHVLAVGIYDYANTRQLAPGKVQLQDLLYPVEDAKELVDLWQGQNKRLFKEVRVTQLYNEAATRGNIRTVLRNMKDRVRPDDHLVVFISGHGFARPVSGIKGPFQPGTYSFCTWDFDLRKAFRGMETGLNSEDISEGLARVRCRKLLLLDTCHSGGAFQGTSDIIRDLTPTNVGPTILAASDFQTEAQEAIPLGHGVFTQAILDANESKFARADLNRDRVLSVRELHVEVQKAVPSLCQEVGLAVHHPVGHLPTLERTTPWFHQK